MFAKRIPLVAFLCSQVAFIVCLTWSAWALPPRVASHFNAAGNANDWMTRESYLIFMAVIACGVPLMMLGIFYAIRWLPMSLVNMPHREYWLAPERRLHTADVMFEFGLGFVTLETLFFTAMNFLVVQANRVQPAQLSNMVWLLLVLFLAVVGAGLIALYRVFRLPGNLARR